MADIGWDELKNSIGAVNDFRKDIANKAANFACGIYKNYPDWAKGSGSAADMLDGLWSGLCDGRPPGLPNASPPFTGGQCLVSYNVHIEYKPNSSFESFGNATYTLPGKILGYIADTGKVEIIYASGSATQPVASGYSATGWLVTAFTVSRADGLPDDCGNPPGRYPSTGSPSISELSSSITVPLPTGLIPSFDVGLVNVDLDAGITVNVGSVNVSFNFDGVTFSPRFGVDFGGSRNPSVDGDSPNTPPLYLPPTASNYDEGDEGEANSGDQSGISNLRWVKIDLTEVPGNAKTEWGNGAPDIYYAGWFEWRAVGCSLPRCPIHFQNNVFQAPEGVEGYAFTLKQGYKGRVRVYTEKG